MGYVIVGYCPKCGAPMYSPTIWFGVGPVPVIRTCNCFMEETQTSSNSY